MYLLFKLLTGVVDTPTNDITGESANTDIKTDFQFSPQLLCVILVIVCLIMLSYILYLHGKIDTLKENKKQ